MLGDIGFPVVLTTINVACLHPLLNLVLCLSLGTQLQNELYWVTNVEQLQFYRGFIAMQSTLGSSCNAYTA